MHSGRIGLDVAALDADGASPRLLLGGADRGECAAPQSGAPRGEHRHLRILMVAARYLPFAGGTETHVREVGIRLVKNGHAVTVLTTDPTGLHPRSEHLDGLAIRRVKAWPKRRDYYFAPAVYTQILRGDWDVVHIQGYHTFVAPIAMLAAIRKRLPFAITFHSGGHSSRLRNLVRKAHAALLRPLVARAQQCIGVSEFEADFFSRNMRLSADRFLVVPNGSELPPPVSVAPSKDTPPLIVSIGRLERYKGHHRVIEAMPHVLRELPSARLRILGTGPYEGNLRKLVAAHGLQDCVTIAGVPPLERQALSELLAGASLVTLLSEYEAHPVAVMEALALRRRVLATDCSGFKEIAARGQLRTVPIDADSQQIARAMLAEMSSTHEPVACELPNWNDCVAQLTTVYQRICRPATSRNGC